MVDVITIMVMEIANILIFSLVILMSARNWKMNKNPIDLALIPLVISSILSIVFKFYEEFNSISIGNLTLIMILNIVFLIIYGWFIVYIFGTSLFYSFSTILGFYLGYYIFSTGNETPYKIISTVIILLTGIILTIHAIKKNNGMTFAIALFAVLSTGAYHISEYIWWMHYVCYYIAGISLILGENGWWTDHVFFNREQRLKIKNTWISSMLK